MNSNTLTDPTVTDGNALAVSPCPDYVVCVEPACNRFGGTHLNLSETGIDYSHVAYTVDHERDAGYAIQVDRQVHSAEDSQIDAAHIWHVAYSGNCTAGAFGGQQQASDLAVALITCANLNYARGGDSSFRAALAVTN